MDLDKMAEELAEQLAAVHTSIYGKYILAALVKVRDEDDRACKILEHISEMIDDQYPGQSAALSVTDGVIKLRDENEKLKGERDALANAIVISRAQWIHSVNAQQCYDAVIGLRPNFPPPPAKKALDAQQPEAKENKT